MDKYSEAIAWLLENYKKPPVKINDKDLLKSFYEIYGKECVEICEDDKNEFPTRNDGLEVLVSVIMLLYLIDSNFKTATEQWSSDMLFPVISLNSFLGKLVMEYDFNKNDRIDFSSSYMPNQDTIGYLGSIVKTNRSLEEIEFLTGNELQLDSDIEQINDKLDKQYISAGISFMALQTVLLVIQKTPIYSEEIKCIAEWMIFFLKDVFADGRIIEMFFDPSILSGHVRTGIKKSTVIKIFLVLPNLDRYCFRLDMPHDDITYVHFNVHEPGKEKDRANAVPMTLKEFDEYKIPKGTLDNIFFMFGKMVWFRNDFINKLYNNYNAEQDADFINEMEKLFHKKGHLQVCKNVNQDLMIEFVNELAIGLNHTPCANQSYNSTSIEDIWNHLTRVKLKDLFQLCVEKYQMIDIEEKLLDENQGHEMLKKEICRYLRAGDSNIVNIFKDIDEMTDKELLVLWEQELEEWGVF